MAVKNLIKPATADVIVLAVQSELYASHLYKQLANQMQRLGYFGARKFFAEEAESEIDHYQKHVDFVNDLGGVVELPALPAITDKPATLMDAVKVAYDTEVALMNDYAAWYSQIEEADPIGARHLLQFLEIQQTSVGEYGDLIARIERAGGDACGILLIDSEMGKG